MTQKDSYSETIAKIIFRTATEKWQVLENVLPELSGISNDVVKMLEPILNNLGCEIKNEDGQWKIKIENSEKFLAHRLVEVAGPRWEYLEQLILFVGNFNTRKLAEEVEKLGCELRTIGANQQIRKLSREELLEQLNLLRSSNVSKP